MILSILIVVDDFLLSTLVSPFTCLHPWDSVGCSLDTPLFQEGGLSGEVSDAPEFFLWEMVPAFDALVSW